MPMTTYMNSFEKRLSELVSTTCTDMDQAMLRVGLMLTVALYLGYFFFTGHIESRDAAFLTAGLAVQTALSVAVVVWTKLVPEYRLSRRVSEFLVDRVGFSWLMSFGGAVTLPLYAMLLWITLGNGLRYGSTFLIVGVAAAFLGIVVAWQVNPFLQANPFVPAMLMFILVVLPMYVLVLLRQIEDAYASAKEANLSKSRFLAQASHDLRQPIHAISLYTACLRDANLQPRELQLVDSIDNSLESVARLFKALLDISTLDSGRVTPRPEPIPIAAVLDDVVKQNREAARRSGGHIHYVRCSQVVWADRALITTMLQNIVNNAIKYAPGRAILIGCRRCAGKLAVVVYDRGPGIAKEHHERVFEEFFQVRMRGGRDVEGVGLGLSIVRRLAMLQGLEVSLRSDIERGTCVKLNGLPIVDRMATAAADSVARMPASIDGLRVLLVEDDANVLRATASLLEKWGCEVHAVTAVPQPVPGCDLLITDYDLGNGMTGSECVRIVRHASGGDLPAIVMTGHDIGRVREDLSDAGIPILAKPVRPAELRSVLLAKDIQALARG